MKHLELLRDMLSQEVPSLGGLEIRYIMSGLLVGVTEFNTEVISATVYKRKPVYEPKVGKLLRYALQLLMYHDFDLDKTIQYVIDRVNEKDNNELDTEFTRTEEVTGLIISCIGMLQMDLYKQDKEQAVYLLFSILKVIQIEKLNIVACESTYLTTLESSKSKKK